MPDKTHSELIRELSGLVTGLGVDMDRIKRDIERHDAALNRLNESLAALSTRMAVLEHQVGELRNQVGELRKTAEESGRRWWSLLPPLVAAIIGGIITVLGQLLLSYLLK